MVAAQQTLISYNTPHKAFNGHGKISTNAPTVVSEQRNFAVCPNVSTTSYLLNNKTGATLPIGCGRWDCPVCGEKKIWKLKKAIFNCIKNWKHIRMMTLSLSSNVSDSREQHYKILQECWRRFITECRRTKTLRADQRNFQFIRVPEQHQSGYMHMHLIIDSYLRQQDLYTIWNHIIHETTKDPFLGGGVHLKDIATPAVGARYIIKYVTKLFSEETYIVRHYSKSGEVVLFTKKYRNSGWSFVFGIRPIAEDEAWDELISFFTCKTKDTTSQEDVSKSDLPPPFFGDCDAERAKFEIKIASQEFTYPNELWGRTFHDKPFKTVF